MKYLLICYLKLYSKKFDRKVIGHLINLVSYIHLNCIYQWRTQRGWVCSAPPLGKWKRNKRKPCPGIFKYITDVTRIQLFFICRFSFHTRMTWLKHCWNVRKFNFLNQIVCCIFWKAFTKIFVYTKLCQPIKIDCLKPVLINCTTHSTKKVFFFIFTYLFFPYIWLIFRTNVLSKNPIDFK